MSGAGVVSQRVKVTLPDDVVAELTDLAANGGEPLARVVAHIVRERRHGTPAVAPSPATEILATQRPGRSAETRPAWLEPYGGDAAWRAQMWGGIVALHGRYPKALAGLKSGWWLSESHVETLCALVVWRQELDEAGRDPREELAFQARLADYAHVLRQEGGGVSREWHPGAPPGEWVR